MDRSTTGRRSRRLSMLVIGTLAACLFAPPLQARADNAKPSTSPTPNDAKSEIVSALVLLLRDDSVRADLKVNTEQTRAVDKCLSEIDYPLWYVREAVDPDTKAKCARTFDHLETVLAKELSTTQRRRLDGILLQAHGWPSVFAPRIAEELKLTADQQTRVRDALAAHQVELKPGGTQPTQATLNKQIEAILNSEQRSRLATLIGPKFDAAKINKRYCRAPPLVDVGEWINSPPLELTKLEGKVVVVHFWTFGCINCIRNLPHYQAWNEKFAGQGAIVVGVHTPETATEKIPEAVRAKVKEFKIAYPVAIDGAAKNWNAWATRWWPSVYLVDKRGYIRYWWAGELNWQGGDGESAMRRRIEELLAE